MPFQRYVCVLSDPKRKQELRAGGRESRMPLLISHAPPLPPPIPSNRLFSISIFFSSPLLFPQISPSPPPPPKSHQKQTQAHTHTTPHLALFFCLSFTHVLSVCLPAHTHTHTSRTITETGRIGAPPYGSVVVHFCRTRRVVVKNPIFGRLHMRTCVPFSLVVKKRQLCAVPTDGWNGHGTERTD